MKLRQRITLLVIGLLVAAILSLTIPLYWYTRSALEDDLDRHLLGTLERITRALDASLIGPLSNEPELATLRATVTAELQQQLGSDLVALALVRSDGRHLADVSRNAGFPTGSIPLPTDTSRYSVSKIYSDDRHGYLKTGYLRIMADDWPVYLAGWASVDFIVVVAQLAGSLLWIALAAIVTAALLALVFSGSLTRPVYRLVEYTRAIRMNRFAEPIDLGRKDELGTLNRALIDLQDEVRSNEQANKELLAGIAHEIKNPLGGIEIYTELLGDELPTEGEAREYLGKITAELRKLKQVVMGYLEFARPPASRIEPQKIDTIAADAARILQPELLARNINFSCRGTALLPGDESKLRQVLVNLLKNSLEAVHSGGNIELVIDEQPAEVTVKIRDDGEGIPADNLEQIFRPHFTTRSSGYGLGLAIVKNIVDEMRGTIVVSSTVGQGTDISMTIPRKWNE